MAPINHVCGILRYSIVFPGERHGGIFLQVNLVFKPGIFCKSIANARRQGQSSYLQLLSERRLLDSYGYSVIVL